VAQLVYADKLISKILSNHIWVVSYFGQPLTYPYFTILSSDFLYNSQTPYSHKLQGKHSFIQNGVESKNYGTFSL
jgi:hypothetical protein